MSRPRVLLGVLLALVAAAAPAGAASAQQPPGPDGSGTDLFVTIAALSWLFLRMAQEGEVRQELIEKGIDERTARRAVRYRRWEELA